MDTTHPKTPEHVLAFRRFHSSGSAQDWNAYRQALATNPGTLARIRRDCRTLADALAEAGYEAEAQDCLRDTNDDTLEHAEERRSALVWLLQDNGIPVPAEARA